MTVTVDHDELRELIRLVRLGAQANARPDLLARLSAGPLTADQVIRSLQSLRIDLQNRRAGMGEPGRGARLAAEARHAETRLRQFREHTARWPRLLSEAVSTADSDLGYAIQRRMRCLIDEGTPLIESRVPRAEFDRWLRYRIAVEVAVLAGVSVDYYARLEQGRERHPSAQVIDAIGRSLQLSPDARGHLYRLAGLNPSLGPDTARALVHPTLLQLLEGFPRAAAYVLGPAFDVLAANRVADALLSPFGAERNMARVVFTHPHATTVFAEWPELGRGVVHALRLNAGLFPGDVEISGLVAELEAASPQFRTWWRDQRVASLTRMYKVFVHPEVGRVELTYQTFDVVDAPGQQLLVGAPEPGSASEEAIAYLAAVAAPV